MIDSHHQKLGKGQEGFYPESQREYGSSNILFWTSSLQDYERINCCSFKPPGLPFFVIATEEANMRVTVRFVKEG